jgi:hypothetical protein
MELHTSSRGIWPAVLVLIAGMVPARADTWAAPKDQEFRSAGGEFVFKVRVAALPHPQRGECRGGLSRLHAGQSRQLWERPLVNRISPVRAMVHDSGRFVVTFDEWHGVGTNPVVIYGGGGELIARLSLADLGLEGHPRITRSVSSYWWNDHAILLFGPGAGDHPTPWRRKLEETLFIRLYWGEVVAIDLATGKRLRRDDPRGLAAGPARFLARETARFLDESYRRLAREYLREENFFRPDPTTEGVRGILLAMQLRLREPLPLLRKIAATERFAGWGAPGTGWGQDARHSDLKTLAEAAIREIEAAADR